MVLKRVLLRGLNQKYLYNLHLNGHLATLMMKNVRTLILII
jgi:hypothetical protein